MRSRARSRSCATPTIGAAPLEKFEDLRRIAPGIESGELRDRSMVALARSDHPGRVNEVTAHQIRCDESRRLLLLFDARIGDRLVAATLLDHQRCAAIIGRRGEGNGLYPRRQRSCSPRRTERGGWRSRDQANRILMFAGGAISGTAGGRSRFGT